MEGKLQTARAQLASFTRPREIVLKHRELVRTALRDEQTVADLETQLQALRLEKARQTDPWELISTPTLLDKPVAPHKKRIMALGLLAGAMAGVIALIKDRRKGLVFSTYELRELLPCSMLKQLPPSAQTWRDAADLLASGPLGSASTADSLSLSLRPSDQVQASRSSYVSLRNRKLIVSSDLLQTSMLYPTADNGP